MTGDRMVNVSPLLKFEDHKSRNRNRGHGSWERRSVNHFNCKEAHDLINGYILYLQVTVAEDKLFLQNMLPTQLEWSPILSFYRYFKDTAMDIIFIIALFIPFQKKVPFLYTWKATSFKSTSLYNFTIYMSPKVPSRMEHSKHTM